MEFEGEISLIKTSSTSLDLTYMWMETALLWDKIGISDWNCEVEFLVVSSRQELPFTLEGFSSNNSRVCS